MRQVYLPKYIFHCVAALTATVKFLIVFCLLLIFLLLSGAKPTWYAGYTLLVGMQFFFISYQCLEFWRHWCRLYRT
jgi:lipopolysaccharide transport system permease protein